MSSSWYHNGIYWCLTLTSIKLDSDRQPTWKRFKTWWSDSLYSVSQNLRFSNPKNMKWRHNCGFFNLSVQADSLFKVPQNMQIWKPCDIKWRHNDVITKNDGKQWENATFPEPNKICIVWKVLMRDVQKCNVFEFEPLCQKLWVFMSSFTMTKR